MKDTAILYILWSNKIDFQNVPRCQCSIQQRLEGKKPYDFDKISKRGTLSKKEQTAKIQTDQIKNCF